MTTHEIYAEFARNLSGTFTEYMPEDPPAHKRAFCATCYLEGIARICEGFTIYHNRKSLPDRIVPPLHPREAAVLRAAAQVHLARYGTTAETIRHPKHAGTY